MRISDWSSDVCSSDLPAWATGSTRTRSADLADIAEKILEEAAFAAQRRRLVSIGLEIGHPVNPGTVNRGDIARVVEPDRHYTVIPDARTHERLPPGDAADIVPGRDRQSIV